MRTKWGNLIRNGLKTSRLITPLKLRQQSRAGFTNRLCRLKPRASRSKGPPATCGSHRVNCRYMISSINIRQNFVLIIH